MNSTMSLVHLVSLQAKQEISTDCSSVKKHFQHTFCLTSISATHFPRRDLPQTGLKSTAVWDQCCANIAVCSGVMSEAYAAVA